MKKNFKRVGVRILAILGALSLVALTYKVVTPEVEDAMPVALDDPGFDYLATLSTHVAAPILDGNLVEHLANGNEIFPAMLSAIRGAQTSVNFLTFVYWTGDVADSFAQELSNAAARGVEVRVLLDAIGAMKMSQDHLEMMRDAGCEVEWFHPVDWYTIRRINRRTHRKVLVVDDEVAFTGGVGIASEWEGDARNAEEWRDDHFRVRGPAATSLLGAFADNWRTVTGEILTTERAMEQSEPAGDSRVVPLFTSPPGDQAGVGFTYWLATQNAKNRLIIATPYFVPDGAFIDALIETAERGVEVKLLVPGKHNDSTMVRWASLALYPKLLKGGVEIFEFEPTMLHSKVVVFDDAISIVGSANFDNRSFELNDEVLLVVEDEALNARLSASLRADLERSERIVDDKFEPISWWRRAVGSVFLTMQEQL